MRINKHPATAIWLLKYKIVRIKILKSITNERRSFISHEKNGKRRKPKNIKKVQINISHFLITFISYARKAKTLQLYI